MSMTRRSLIVKGALGLAAATQAWTPGEAQEASPNPNATVDLLAPQGKKLARQLYGYSTGALFSNDFALAADPAVKNSARILEPPVLRFNTPSSGVNASQTLTQAVFANGVKHPDWRPLDAWVRNQRAFLGYDGILVFGIGPGGGDTSLSPTVWASYADAIARYFRSIGQEIMYWEVGNECDPMGAQVYSTYFNAIADALHAVDSRYLVGGPVGSWFNGIDLAEFVKHSASSGIGFIDFHSYPVNTSDSLETAYSKAATFGDVGSARQSLAGTPAANLPIALLEYNMNGEQQPDGSYGLPIQGTVKGAVYVALLLTQGFMSDENFVLGGLWDLVSDSNYGAIGNSAQNENDRAIDPQGLYLREAARLLPGDQVAASTTLPNLQILATRDEVGLSIQLVNYDTVNSQSVTIEIQDRSRSEMADPWLRNSILRRWELSAAYPFGQVSYVGSLRDVEVPSQGIVILTAGR
jgi:hypothetical protein